MKKRAGKIVVAVAVVAAIMGVIIHKGKHHSVKKQTMTARYGQYHIRHR